MLRRIITSKTIAVTGLAATIILAISLGNSLFTPKNCTPPTAICTVTKDVVRWHVLDVSDATAQADAHLLQFGNGSTVLIDAGETTNRLAPRILQRGIRRIDRVLISHPHKDHYNALPSLIEAGISIGNVHLNLPPESICNAERPWGCDYEDLLSLRARLKQSGLVMQGSEAGDVYVRYGEVELSALVAHDGVSPPVGPTDINDLSVIILLKNGTTRALFTGDLNKHLGEHLATSGDPRLKAELLKVPHHGTEGLAPNSFFSLVSPSVAFVPAPISLWLSDRSKRPRDWFEASKIPTYVTGRDGAVTVDIFPTRYSVERSR